MARKTFFSFHYQRDVNRANVVRQSWVTKPNRDEAGFFDKGLFEAKQRSGEDLLKRFLSEALAGTSVCCVLAGAETAYRRWVRYELIRSFQQGKGILAVRIHGIADMKTRQTDVAGPNPFDELAYQVNGPRVTFQEKNGGSWQAYADVEGMDLADVPYSLGTNLHHTFSTLFSTYDWVQNDGYNRLGDWVEAAARQAGR
jgi:hypothetical protein